MRKKNERKREDAWTEKRGIAKRFSGVPSTLIAPAQVVRRAQVRAESPFSTRRCTKVLQAVENGERKTNSNKKEENLPRFRGRFSTLICVYHARSFHRAESFNGQSIIIHSFSGLCVHTRVVPPGSCARRTRRLPRRGKASASRPSRRR